MNKKSETKTVSQICPNRTDTKHIKSSRRNTIATGGTLHLDSFEEMARNIAINRTDKSYSYNIHKRSSEENTSCVRRNWKQNGFPRETFRVDKLNAVDSNKADNKKTNLPQESRQSSIATGSKVSLAISMDKRVSSATGGRQKPESTHVTRYQQQTRRFESPAVDKRKPCKESKCEKRNKCDRKCSVLCKNCTHTQEKTNQGIHKSTVNCDRTAKSENCYEECKVVSKQNIENGSMPLLKTSPSNSKLSFESESSSLVENDTFYGDNFRNDHSGAQLSPPVVETEYTKRKRSGGSSASPVRSLVSSGSRKSSLSQRSELSLASTTSCGSLAEKIMETRTRRTQEILRDRESGSMDSQSFLPPNFSSRRCSVTSLETRQPDSFVLYPEEHESAASNTNLKSDRNENTNNDNSLQKSERSPIENKKHLPDNIPKEGENSVPIRTYRRKHVRKVLEA